MSSCCGCALAESIFPTIPAFALLLVLPAKPILKNIRASQIKNLGVLVLSIFTHAEKVKSLLLFLLLRKYNHSLHQNCKLYLSCPWRSIAKVAPWTVPCLSLPDISEALPSKGYQATSPLLRSACKNGRKKRAQKVRR